MPSAFEFPTRATAAETEAGCLSAERLAHLEAAARRLRRAGSVAAAAEAVGLSPVTYRQNFSTLARLAGWESRTADDYLAKRPTQRGGARGGGHAPGKTPRTDALLNAQLHVRMTSDDRALLDQALERFSGTTNDFLAEAARRSLAAAKPW